MLRVRLKQVTARRRTCGRFEPRRRSGGDVLLCGVEGRQQRCSVHGRADEVGSSRRKIWVVADEGTAMSATCAHMEEVWSC